MKSVNVTFQVEESVKQAADALFDDLGMSLSTALNLFLRQAVREQGIPFTVSAKAPNETTLAAMEAAERGEDMRGPFNSLEELMEALNA